VRAVRIHVVAIEEAIVVDPRPRVDQL